MEQKPTPQFSANNSVSTTCGSVLALTPDDDCIPYRGNGSSHNSTPIKSSSAIFDKYHTNRTLSHSFSSSAITTKNPRIDISCFTLPDSDSEGHHSPLRPLPNFTNSVMSKLIKPEPQKNPLSGSMTDISKSHHINSASQKKRLLAKAQQQAHLQNQKQIPQIRIDNLTVAAKQEILSSEDEDSLMGRLNYLNAQNYNNANNRRYNQSLEKYWRDSSTKFENLEGEKLIKCAVSPNRVCF